MKSPRPPSRRPRRSPSRRSEPAGGVPTNDPDGVELDEHERTISRYYGSDVRVIISIKINTSKAEEIASALADMDAIESIYLVTGDIDIIVKARFKDYSEMQDLIIKRIGTIPGVKETKTMVIVTAFKG